MNKKKDLKIQLTEIFMAKAGRNGWDRCFHGTIKRETDAEGNPVVIGRIKVLNGFIYAMAEDQWVLGDMLDDMVLMILDKGLHSETGKTTKICDTDYFLN
jgi:hypothetical protein